MKQSLDTKSGGESEGPVKKTTSFLNNKKVSPSLT